VAERFFRDLLKEGDDNENTVLGLATTCERLGKAYDDVSRAVGKGERPATDGLDADKSAHELEQRARSYWDESIRLCEAILTKGEGNRNAMNTLQRVQALVGNYDESLKWSDRLLERTAAERESWQRMLQEKNLTAKEEAFYQKNERTAVELESDTHVFA